MPVKSAPDDVFAVEWALVDPPSEHERVEEKPGWLTRVDVATRGDGASARRDLSRPERRPR
jgi:hypothetical protein